MWNNYIPVQAQLLRDVYGVEPPAEAYPPETWPDYMAPIIRRDSNGDRQAVLGNFGMMPKARIPTGVKPFDTTNARSESVGEKRTFSGAWKKRAARSRAGLPVSSRCMDTLVRQAGPQLCPDFNVSMELRLFSCSPSQRVHADNSESIQ